CADARALHSFPTRRSSDLRFASAVCELPGLAAISASTVSEPVGRPCGADTTIDRADSAFLSRRTRGPTDPSRMPQSSFLPTALCVALARYFCNSSSNQLTGGDE